MNVRYSVGAGHVAGRVPKTRPLGVQYADKTPEMLAR